jgi:Na+-transporting NADH:ubiquinone oxidoreductase subunit NqrF
MNLKIADEILKGKEVRFPRRMGALEIRKKPTKVEYIDGEIVDNLKVDWDTTLKLWYEDKESYDNKTIIKLETDETFLVYYHKRRAVFNNRSYYAFSTNN